jgi:hypothetical protein
LNNNIMPYLTQLMSLSPLLLVYFVGLILALVFWRRCPTPSLLVVIAGVLLLALGCRPVSPFNAGRRGQMLNQP